MNCRHNVIFAVNLITTLSYTYLLSSTFPCWLLLVSSCWWAFLNPSKDFYLYVLGIKVVLQVAKAYITPANGFLLHCLNLCLLLLLPVIFINLSFLHFGLVSAVLVCCLYSIIFLKLVSYIQVEIYFLNYL